MEQYTPNKEVPGKEVQHSNRIREVSMNIVKEGTVLFDRAADWMAGIIWNAVKPKEVPVVKKLNTVITQPIPIRGVMYEGRQEIIKALTLDTKLTLVPIPTNPVDKDAIGVFADDNQIGWIPAKPIEEWNEIPRILVHDKLRKGKHVSIVSWFKVGGTKEFPKVGVKIRLKIER